MAQNCNIGIQTLTHLDIYPTDIYPTEHLSDRVDPYTTWRLYDTTGHLLNRISSRLDIYPTPDFYSAFLRRE